MTRLTGLLALSFLFSAPTLFAQQELGSHFMQGMWQATLTNPAMLPDAKVLVALPSFYSSTYNSGFTFNDVVINRDGTDFFDLDGAIPQLKEDNFIQQYLSVDVIGVALTFDQLNVQFGWSARGIIYNKYPKELVQLVWDGNAQFLGQTVAVGPENILTGYHSFYVGGAYKINDFITVGARGKLLNGVAELSTSNGQTQVDLFSREDDFALTLASNYRLNSSGNIEYNGLDDITLDYGFDDFEFGDAFSNNFGFAFDLGIQIQLGKFDINASALNLGRIRWKSDVSNITFTESEENTFSGLDVVGDFLRSDSVSFDGLLDTLETLLVVDTTRESFNSPLPSEYYISGVYQLNKVFSFGALLYLQHYQKEVFPAFGLSAHARVSKWFQGGITYSYRQRSWDGLGLNMVVSLGPVQLLAATDTFIGLVNPYNTRSVNFRFGLNLAFNRVFEERVSGLDAEANPSFY